MTVTTFYATNCNGLRYISMSRRSRLVIPGCPHHITQRGVRRQDVFFSPSDREIYINLLSSNAKRYSVEVLAYCLQTNHVHHLLVPHEKDSLRYTLQITHKRYAEYINASRGWTGHLWQQRFYSSPVDERFFWITLRYIERNPVAAKIVKHAAEYPWSSAQAHCGLRPDRLLTSNSRWTERIAQRPNWYQWLGESDLDDDLQNLRKCTSGDLPCGSDAFLDTIEAEYLVRARPAKLGRPKKR